MKTKLLLAAGLTLSLSAFAQTNSETPRVIEPMSSTPTFRVNVVSRNVQAVNYQHRSGAQIDFAHRPDAQITASKGRRKKGYIEIKWTLLLCNRLSAMNTMSYILWAISPSRAINPGEILVGEPPQLRT